MKIVVTSDSHGDVLSLKNALQERADAYFHCGDSERNYDDPTLQSMYRVKGNCDFDNHFPEEVIVTIHDKRILMVHGHLHNVKNNLMSLFYEGKEQQVQIVLFGHSHLFGAEMQEGILFVNPGSTLLPRGGNPATYAVIEWNQEVTVTFKTIAGEEVAQTTFTVNEAK